MRAWKNFVSCGAVVSCVLAIVACSSSSGGSTAADSDAGAVSDATPGSDSQTQQPGDDAGACAPTPATYLMHWTFENQVGSGTCTAPADDTVTFPITSPGAGCKVDTSICPTIGVLCNGAIDAPDYTYVVQTSATGGSGTNGDIIQANLLVSSHFTDGGDLSCYYTAVPQKQ